jgi:hypothetical protein
LPAVISRCGNVDLLQCYVSNLCAALLRLIVLLYLAGDQCLSGLSQLWIINIKLIIKFQRIVIRRDIASAVMLVSYATFVFLSDPIHLYLQFSFEFRIRFNGGTCWNQHNTISEKPRGCYCIVWDSYFVVARRSVFTAWKLENSPRMLNSVDETDTGCV